MAIGYKITPQNLVPRSLKMFVTQKTASLSLHFLGLKIDKSDQIRRSKWSDPLSTRQVKYAATDADISLKLFDCLTAKILKL